MDEGGRKSGREGTNGDELSSNLSLGRVVDVALLPGLRSDSLDLSSVLVEGSGLDHPGEGEEAKEKKQRRSVSCRQSCVAFEFVSFKRLTSSSPGPWVQVPIVEGTCHAPIKRKKAKQRVSERASKAKEVGRNETKEKSTHHDAPLNLSNDSVIARREVDGGHERDTESDGLSLGGHDNDLLVDLDVGFVSQESGNHELGSVADGVDGGILDHESLVSGEEGLERSNDSSEVGLWRKEKAKRERERLINSSCKDASFLDLLRPSDFKVIKKGKLTISSVVVNPLGIENVVHGDLIVRLSHRSRPDSSKLLHVSSDSQQQTQVHTERPDVGSSLARDVEDGESSLVVELDQVGLVDGSDSKLPLDGGDERRSLEEGTGEGLEGSSEGLLVLKGGVESKDGDVLLSGSLLGLDESSGSVDADEEASSDLGIEGSRVTGLLTSEDSSKPSDDFVGGGVGGLVEVDDSRPEEGGKKERKGREGEETRKGGQLDALESSFS